MYAPRVMVELALVGADDGALVGTSVGAAVGAVVSVTHTIRVLECCLKLSSKGNMMSEDTSGGKA